MIKKIVRIIPLVLVVWFIITLFFYVQHYRVMKVYKVDKEVVLEDMIIKLKEITIKNYRYNDKIQKIHSTYESLWYYKLAPKLPRIIQSPFIKLCHFYSRPYVYNNQFGTLNNKGLILFETRTISPENNIWDFIEISLMDENERHYDRSKLIYNESESNYLIFNIHDEKAPFNNELFKIIVKDKRNQTEQMFITDSQWEIKTLTYFDQEKVEYDFDPVEIADKFVKLMVQGEKEKAHQYLLTGPQKEKIWSILNHNYWELKEINYVLFEGRHAGLEDVYSLNITFGQFEPGISDDILPVAEQKIYFIERENSPTIIDANPVIRMSVDSKKRPQKSSFG